MDGDKEILDTVFSFMKQRKQAAKSNKNKGLTDEQMKEAIEAAKRLEKNQKEYAAKFPYETEEEQRRKKRF